MYKQVGFSNANVAILSSDFLGTADVYPDRVEKASDWPANLPGYTMAFADDDFTHEYPITSVSGQDLILDTAEKVPASALGSRWVIRGRPKGEYFFLASYVVQYALLTDSQKGYRRAGSGEPEALS